MLLGDGEATERAIKVLDHIPPYDTHKIGVIYTARGQVWWAGLCVVCSVVCVCVCVCVYVCMCVCVCVCVCGV